MLCSPSPVTEFESLLYSTNSRLAAEGKEIGVETENTERKGRMPALNKPIR